MVAGLRPDGIGPGVQRVADPSVPTAVLTDTLRLVLGLDAGHS
ncbi:hypothetical protein ACH47C_16515 [Streptomyces rishiriensis]